MFKPLIVLFKFYIKSSIHVALALVSLSLITLNVGLLDVSKKVLIFIFFSTLFVYNFIKFFPLVIEGKRKKIPISISLLSVSAGLTSFLLYFYLSLLAQIFVFLGATLVIFYGIPIFNKSSNWRNKKGWKIYLVVLSWLFLSVGVPLASNIIFQPILFLKLTFIQGIFIFVAILPFEIRDLLSDDLILSTIPQKFGISITKKIGCFLLIIGFIFTFFQFYNQTPWIISTGFSFLILALMLYWSSTKKAYYYTAFYVEGIPIIWYLSLYLITYF